MHRPPSYTESAYFIHQRYEDTALVIFQQQQKKKESAVSFGSYTPLPFLAPPPSGRFQVREQNRVSPDHHIAPTDRYGLPTSGHTSPTKIEFVQPPPKSFHSKSDQVLFQKKELTHSPLAHISPKSDQTVLQPREKDFSEHSRPLSPGSTVLQKKPSHPSPAPRNPQQSTALSSSPLSANLVLNSDPIPVRTARVSPDKVGEVKSGSNSVDAPHNQAVSWGSNGVEFGRFGSVGVVAKNTVLTSKSDSHSLQSRICHLM